MFIHFFKTKISSICFAGVKSALSTWLAHSYRQKTESLSVKSGNGWRIERKILKPNIFPRKDCLAHRVQFCKPCRTKISQNWSWINQNTKNTQKCTIFNRMNYPENVAWTPKNNFDNCDEVSGRNSRGFSFKVRNW